jgi:hypothetical protein
MPVFELARRPTHWVRVALVAMLLAFAINSIAHVSHQHDDPGTTASVAHSVACGYCASFGSLADAPKHTYSLPGHEQPRTPVATIVAAAISALPQTSAQPRAPPLS